MVLFALGLGLGLSRVPFPPLCILIMAVGTRGNSVECFIVIVYTYIHTYIYTYNVHLCAGDVQPFISFGLQLQAEGHRGIKIFKYFDTKSTFKFVSLRENFFLKLIHHQLPIID